ncbi:ribosomal RNA small subunit methyltransferase H [bacterium SM23_57]|jgi:16S rRNA (cytosine1402-N4)-methyltransferase|nr:MAG: ribosomal RNA small subunit methyltransferase H [bacterium SM23_57]
MTHLPVLYHEILHALRPHDGGLYVDGTVGAGGHAWGILESSAPNGRLLGIDVDSQALALARERLAKFGDRVILKKASYTTLNKQINEIGWSRVDGILLDLGVSSMQLDSVHRGFSFRNEAPLDMRFDMNGMVTAADLVNGLPENALADILYQYGEEQKSHQIARGIVAHRPVRTTKELAEIVTKVVKHGKGKLHPATRTFQALRIATNDELSAIETVLPQAVASLKSEGRLAVIAFHSLEDRIVKQFFRRESQDCLCPPRQPVCTCHHKATIREISRHPIRPDESEIYSNPRARSARCRVAERL